MSASPYYAHQSPLQVGWLGHTQAQSLTDSPSDSRVPRTPKVERSSIVLDQNVPLTPVGYRRPSYESPGGATIHVPSTPEATISLSNNILSPTTPSTPNILRPVVSLSSTPCRSDQLVPSTPKNLRRRNHQEDKLGVPFLSPVPYCSSTPRSNRLLHDSLSPVQWSSESGSSCNRTPFSPTPKNSRTDESGYLSSSSSIKNVFDSTPKSTLNDTSLLLASPDEIHRKREVHLSVRARKAQPPSRRRLSLCGGQQDTLRRTAHHNRNVHKIVQSQPNDEYSSSRPRTSSVCEDVLNSTNDSENRSSTSFSDSGVIEVSLEEGSQLTRPSPKSIVKPLMSPAGDAASFLVGSKSSESTEQRFTWSASAEFYHDSRAGCSGDSCSSVSATRNIVADGVETEKDILDLCGGDDSSD